MNSLLTGIDPDAGKDWRQKEKGVEEDEMVGWRHQFNQHKVEQTPGDSEGPLHVVVHGVTESDKT